MKYTLYLFLYFLLNVHQNVVGQNVVIWPENPQPGQHVHFRYNPAHTPLDSSLLINCVAYMFEETGRFTKPIDILLTKNDGVWIGGFDVLSGGVAFALTFMDERGVPDNNHGKGYYYYIKDRSGEILGGAKASIAQCYVQESNILKLEVNLKKAKELFEKEFDENNQLKPYYILSYSYTFDRNNPAERFDLISELDKLYNNRSALDEMTLTDISLIYNKLLLKDRAEECTEYTIQKYPNGKQAFQLTSLPFQKDLRETSELNRKLKIYKRMNKYFTEKLQETGGAFIRSEGAEGLLVYNNEFTPSYTWARNEVYYHAIQYISLNHLLEHCWDANQIDRWLKLVEDVDNEWLKMKLYDKFSQQSVYRNENVTKAFELSSKASDWNEQHIKSERTLREKTFYMVSDSFIGMRRRMDYANVLITKSELLLKLNKKEEALMACNEAIENSNLADIRLNDRIVELLLNSGYEKEAKDISKIAIGRGKASNKLKKLISGDVIENGNSIVDSLAGDHVKDVYSYLAARRINTPAPAFDLVNVDGEIVLLSDFKDKVVVLDFWATWCGPCLISFPAFREVIEKYKMDSEVKFLFINLDTEKEGMDKEIKAFMNKKKYDFEVLMDPKGITSQDYAVSALPTKIVIDKNGTINFRSVGLKKDKEEMIEELSLMIEMARKSN